MGSFSFVCCPAELHPSKENNHLSLFLTYGARLSAWNGSFSNLSSCSINRMQVLWSVSFETWVWCPSESMTDLYLKITLLKGHRGTGRAQDGVGGYTPEAWRNFKEFWGCSLPPLHPTSHLYTCETSYQTWRG